MKVENVQPSKPILKPEKVVPEKKAPIQDTAKERPAAVYEKSETNKDIGHLYDKNAVNRIKLESERAYGHLRRIVVEMLARQGKTLEILDPSEVIEIDETARLEAQELIGPDGELGVEKTSQRIVDFAIAISGGDKSKLDTLRKAIDQGFKEAEKILGELPDISKETYTRIMEKLDAWEKGE